MKTEQRALLQQAQRLRETAEKAARRQRERAETAAFLAALDQPVSQLAGQREHLLVLAALPADHFFRTPEWRRTRFEALALHGRQCQHCGAKPADAVRLSVTHVVPRLLRPDLAFDLRNLAVLCEDCRIGRASLARPGR